MSSFAGALETRESQKLAARAMRDSKLPYVWRKAPPGSIHFSPFGALTVLTGVSNQIVVTYTIPMGFTGVLTGVLLDVAQVNGQNVAWVPGDVSWSLALNFSVEANNPGLPAFRYFQDFVNVPFTVGSFATSGQPWPIWSGESDLLPSKTVLSVLATPSLTFPTTGGAVWRASLAGYRFPNLSQT